MIFASLNSKENSFTIKAQYFFLTSRAAELSVIKEQFMKQVILLFFFTACSQNMFALQKDEVQEILTEHKITSEVEIKFISEANDPLAVCIPGKIPEVTFNYNKLKKMNWEKKKLLVAHEVTSCLKETTTELANN